MISSKLLAVLALVAGPVFAQTFTTPCNSNAECAKGETCVTTNARCTDVYVCGGQCQPTPSPPKPVVYKQCGGPGPAETFTCPLGFMCIDDPRTDGCGKACGQPGICVPNKNNFCGGYANLKCEDPNKKCYEDPSDGCDPATGGRDCGGICV